jgi:uncharacterized membrane protein
VNLPDGLLGGGWILLSWLLFVGVALVAVRRAPCGFWPTAHALNAFLATIVALIVLWHLQAGVRPGLSLHLLGATVFTLCFGLGAGLHRSLPGAGRGSGLNGFAGWQSFAVNALLMAGVRLSAVESCAASSRSIGCCRRHIFVYIFCKGFFASALALIAVRSERVRAAGAQRDLLGRLPGWRVSAVFSAARFFSEAWLSGMMATLFAVFQTGTSRRFRRCAVPRTKMNCRLTRLSDRTAYATAAPC